MKTTQKINTLIKCHGGKAYLAKWIYSFFPKHEIFVDVCGGGGTIVLNKEPAKLDWYNDINSDLVAMFDVVAGTPSIFYDIISNLSYTEETFERFKLLDPKDYVERAVRTYVVHRMSRGGLGKSFAWSNRLRGGQPGDLNAWENAIDNIYNISTRLRRMRITCMNFDEIIPYSDSKETLFYIDPPYLHSTRVSTKAYKSEMNEEQHRRLLTIIKSVHGKVILSGYPSDLYTEELKGWRVEQKEVPNHSSQQAKKELKIETLWLNF